MPPANRVMPPAKPLLYFRLTKGGFCCSVKRSCVSSPVRAPDPLAGKPMSDALKRFEEVLVRLGNLDGLPPPAFPACLGESEALEHLLAALDEASGGRWNAVVDSLRNADVAP